MIYSRNRLKESNNKNLMWNKIFKWRSCLILLLGLLTLTSISCAQAPDNRTDIEWLIDVLKLEQGSVVADIGAGDGDQTEEIAQYIGSEGLIYSTELGSNSIRDLRQGVEDSNLKNINILEGSTNATNLPAECCDAIYMRRVYHHIKNPEAFNASLFETLKPGGKLAIIDFEPRGTEADPSGRASGRSHGVTNETVVDELKKAGFQLISSEQPSGRDIYVVMQRPPTDNIK